MHACMQSAFCLKSSRIQFLVVTHDIRTELLSGAWLFSLPPATSFLSVGFGTCRYVCHPILLGPQPDLSPVLLFLCVSVMWGPHVGATVCVLGSCARMCSVRFPLFLISFRLVFLVVLSFPVGGDLTVLSFPVDDYQRFLGFGQVCCFCSLVC